MFERISRGWRITKQSFRLIGHDPELLAFPALAAVLGTVGVVLVTASFGGAIYTFAPELLSEVGEQTGGEPSTMMTLVGILYLFAVSFVGALTTIFANFAILNTMRVRLGGGDATFADSVHAANQRLGHITKWALVVTSLGVMLHIIESACERLGGIGSLVLRGLTALMGGAWGVVSFMVVPAMVFDGVGPKEGLSRSFEALKRSWGEGLSAHVSIGFVGFMAVIPFVVMLGVGGMSLVTAMETGTSPLFGAGIMCLATVYMIVVSLILSVARVLFAGALYRFATTGDIGDDYDDDLVRGAFTPTAP